MITKLIIISKVPRSPEPCNSPGLIDQTIIYVLETFDLSIH